MRDREWRFLTADEVVHPGLQCSARAVRRPWHLLLMNKGTQPSTTGTATTGATRAVAARTAGATP